MRASRVIGIWFLPNAAAAGLYLSLTSTLWVQPGDEGNPGGPGDGFYWVLVLVPFVMLVFAVNVVALIAVAARSRTEAARRVPLWFVIAVLWGLTLSYDQQRSFRVIRGCYSTRCPDTERSIVSDRRSSAHATR